MSGSPPQRSAVCSPQCDATPSPGSLWPPLPLSAPSSPPSVLSFTSHLSILPFASRPGPSALPATAACSPTRPPSPFMARDGQTE